MAYGTVDKKYISSVSMLDQREILHSVLDITNEEASLLDIMELAGRSVETAVPEYNHFVNEELYALGTVDTGGVAAGTTASMTLTLTSGTSAAARVGDQVIFKDKMVGYVYSKSGNDIVVKSVTGDNFAGSTTVQAADQVAFFSNAAGEGSGSPSARKYSLTKYANQVQIFKDKFEITQIQLASKVEVKYQGKDYILYKGQHDALLKFRADISHAMIMGKKSATKFSDSNPSLVDASGNAIQTTQGLDSYVTDLGISKTLAGSNLALVDLANLTKEFNLRRCPDQYLVYLGTQKNIDWDNLFNGLTQAGSANNVTHGGRFTIQGKELDLGIDTVRLYGRTYFKKYLPMLDHKNVVNFTTASNIKDTAYFVPNSKIKAEKSNEMIDRMRIRYMAAPGTDLRYVETNTGKFAPVPIGEESKWTIHYESVQGLEILGATHFAKIV